FEEAGGRIDLEEIKAHGHTQMYQDLLLGFAEPALVKGWREVLGNTFGAMSQGRVAEVADGVAEMIKATMLELPYILSYRFHTRDRRKAHGFYESFGLGDPGYGDMRVAIMTDTVDEINGVALGLRRLH